MKISPFLTEHFYAQYEFTTPYQLCNSDCETLTVEELLKMANVSWQEFGKLSLGYTETLGNPELRKQISATYLSVHPSEVIVLGTPVEGIYLVARAVLDPGDEVIVLSPAYDALINIFEHVVGASHVKKWEFIPGDNYWELDFSQLQRMISPQTKLLVVNFPHNPTGYLPSQSQLEELARLTEQHNMVLFCDEMYFGLVHSGNQEIKSAIDVTPQAIVLSGLSKTYGLPGLRTGWLIVKDEAIRKNLINWKFYTSICPPAPSEFLAQAALKVRSQLIERSIMLIEQNLQLAEDFFQRWPDLFKWRKPMAGPVALVHMNVDSVTRFADELAEKAGVLIQPALTLGSTDQYLRMGFGRAAFPEALEKFEAYLHQ
ncbi:MAG: pyridoxal phosphate-dependent aminotransferase [Anaerolineaceae bacterium]|nr:pyridoxal phosphate-dependent aminotransferase [Anaerolineaceae bacterium]